LGAVEGAAGPDPRTARHGTTPCSSSTPRRARAHELRRRRRDRESQPVGHRGRHHEGGRCRRAAHDASGPPRGRSRAPPTAVWSPALIDEVHGVRPLDQRLPRLHGRLTVTIVHPLPSGSSSKCGPRLQLTNTAASSGSRPTRTTAPPSSPTARGSSFTVDPESFARRIGRDRRRSSTDQTRGRGLVD